MAEMRAEMVSLGYGDEAAAAKGTSEVRKALEHARSAPRQQPMDTGEAVVAPEPSPPRVPAEVLDVRWHESEREYRVRWQGEESADSWVDEVTLSHSANEAVVGFDWDRKMLADETDHSSDSDSDSDSEVDVPSSPQVMEHEQSPVVEPTAVGGASSSTAAVHERQSDIAVAPKRARLERVCRKRKAVE